MRGWRFGLLLLLVANLAWAGEVLEVCFNYGCHDVASVLFGDAELEEVRLLLAGASDPAQERALLALAVGRMYAVAGQQSPVRNDRGGNYDDAGVHGRMDCIDHSTTTTRFLQLIEQRGWMNWHRVLGPERRSRFIIQHFSAALESLPQPRRVPGSEVPDHVPLMLALCDCPAVLVDVPQPAPQPVLAVEKFVVDSWFVDNGQPAVVLPWQTWFKGGGPDVE